MSKNNIPATYSQMVHESVCVYVCRHKHIYVYMYAERKKKNKYGKV